MAGKRIDKGNVFLQKAVGILRTGTESRAFGLRELLDAQRAFGVGDVEFSWSPLRQHKLIRILKRPVEFRMRVANHHRRTLSSLILVPCGKFSWGLRYLRPVSQLRVVRLFR